MSTLPRHSPRWSSGAFVTRDVIIPAVATGFDKLVSRVGLENRPDLWMYNEKLVAFAKKNRKYKYVPESFLDELGLKTEFDFD